LEKVDTGGYEIRGYVAGLPFPRPSEPELGAKVLYNARYANFPAVVQAWFHGFQIDRFLNLGMGEGEVGTWRLSHISVLGQPINPAYGKGYLSSTRITVMVPEQFKYFTSLSLQPDDISVPAEFWVYLAEERRPLRLSSSARCAPLLGSDLVNDDQNSGLFFLPADFKITFLGERNILVLAHATKDPSVRFHTDSIIMRGSVPGWPKPALGQWELRKVYLLDVTPLPVMGRYCYAHKVLYIDKESWLVAGIDIYDADSKLWKTVVGADALIADNNGEGDMIPVIHNFAFLDFQNSHASGSMPGPYKLDRDAGAQFQDAAVAAFPGGLMDIMK
jgi:Protein of unknown function (DUF1329)